MMMGGASPAPRRSSPSTSVFTITRLSNYFLLILAVFGVLSLWVNTQHGLDIVQQISTMEALRLQYFSVESSPADQGHPLAPKPMEESDQESDPEKQTSEEEYNEQVDANIHNLAGLQCDAFGGPSAEVAKEMVYWSDIPSDNTYVSPFHQPSSLHQRRYMTFEPDRGGWNNIRMSMETVLAMAVATGRTLVLPPEQPMYLLDKDTSHDGTEQQRHFSFNDFFHMESIDKEHSGLEIITMEEFLSAEAVPGHLQVDGKPVFPPQNRSDWNGQKVEPLTQYLRNTALWPSWDPEECMAAFATSPEETHTMQELYDDIIKQGGFPEFEQYVGKPFPVDAPPQDRMKENWAGRNRLCLYDDEMQKAPLLHFGYDGHQSGARLLVHFYAFLFFEDWRQDLWMKRFVRDHVRYVDEIQCAAARIVEYLRERARQRNPASNGAFDAFHIRRGDFQYLVTRFEAPRILMNSKDELTPNATVYIATDERNRTFFQPLADEYDVVFLDDVKHLIKDVNTNFYGMVDQLVASRGRVFFGCWFSTFTGYINRIRGYHVDKEKLPGHEQGLVPGSYYYALEDRKFHMQTFYPVKKSFYAREFPTSWRGIDKGIGELPTSEA